IRMDGQTMANCRQIVSMGGGAYIGNMSPVAEFNYWVDPDAAKEVYDFTIPITMVGLNVTTQIVFTPTIFEFIKKLGKPAGELIDAMRGFYLGYHWDTERKFGCNLHDPLAVAVACDPQLVKTTLCNVEISDSGVTRGECLCDLIDAWKKRKNCRVALEVDREGFLDRFFGCLYPENAAEYRDFKGFLKGLR
ncbi:MAG: nucleoside hydrolase, partial [Clostridia bacterium]|nr:nucleoside hydrolase [Clostridia bacterium]